MSTMSSQYKPSSQLGLADQKLNFHGNNNLICLTLTENWLNYFYNCIKGCCIIIISKAL